MDCFMNAPEGCHSTDYDTGDRARVYDINEILDRNDARYAAEEDEEYSEYLKSFEPPTDAELDEASLLYAFDSLEDLAELDEEDYQKWLRDNE